MDDKINIRFRLASIDKEQFALNSEVANNLIIEERLKFQYKIETLVQMTKNTILVKASARYSYENQELLECSATFTFEVSNLSSAIIVDKENQTLNAKADIFPSLVSAAYSTLRGIVFAKTTGTTLAKYPMPMVDVKTLVEKNGIALEE